jgi:hypothetical protein
MHFDATVRATCRSPGSVTHRTDLNRHNSVRKDVLRLQKFISATKFLIFKQIGLNRRRNLLENLIKISFKSNAWVPKIGMCTFLKQV